MALKFEKPLIGIEWEPQVSLQKYPNYLINISWIDTSVIKVSRFKNYVHLFIPSSLENMLKEKNMYIDVGNMEIYTDPVDIKYLNAEIAKRDKLLKEFWVLVANSINQMIGVFLPASNKSLFVTKHISMSYMVKPEITRRLIEEYRAGKQRRNPYEPKFDIKGVIDTYHHQRVHITVPYNFQHYEALYKSYLKAYHRDLLWYVFYKGKDIYTDSATKAYVRNEDNRIDSWLKDLKGWLLEYAQDNPMNEPILLGIATPTKFAEKHKLI
jgi:hypothetical protein